MFEEGELNKLSLSSHCNFCDKKIKFMPLTSTDKKLKFCDIVCAKLYYDNVKQIEIDRNEYNNYYINEQLSKKAKDIYSKVGGTLFKQLPVYVPSPCDEAFGNPELMKKKYCKILNPVLFR